jgi:hypothetical protein
LYLRRICVCVSGCRLPVKIRSARRVSAGQGWGIRRADEPVAVGLVQTPLLDADQAGGHEFAQVDAHGALGYAQDGGEPRLAWERIRVAAGEVLQHGVAEPRRDRQAGVEQDRVRQSGEAAPGGRQGRGSEQRIHHDASC